MDIVNNPVCDRFMFSRRLVDWSKEWLFVTSNNDLDNSHNICNPSS